MLVNLVIVFVVFVAGFAFGAWRAAKFYANMLAEMEEAATSPALQNAPDAIRFAIDEIHNGVHYLFDANTGQFLAQGKDADEIVDHLRKRNIRQQIEVVDVKDSTS